MIAEVDGAAGRAEGDDEAGPGVPPPPQGSRLSELEAEVVALREQVDLLTAQFAQFKKQFE